MKKLVALFLCLCLVASLGVFVSASAAVYTASAQGFGSIVKVTVEYDGDKIVSIEVDDSGETYPVAREDSVEKVIAAIIAANGTGDVDVKTGATSTCTAIVNAVNATRALVLFGMGGSGILPDDKGNTEIGFTAGSYEATAEGFNGPTTVKVTFTDKAIEAIEILSTGETDTVGCVAFETLIPLMIEANGSGVDGVSGATFSSTALRNALNDAAEQAGCTDLEAFMAATVEPAEEDSTGK